MAVENPVLSVSGLTAGYGKLEILHGIDFHAGSGEFVCLLGPNGAGKSSILKTLFGMTTWMAGTASFQGVELRGRTQRQLLDAGIAYVPQGRCNFPLMSVEENIDVAIHGRTPAEAKAERERCIDLFPALAKRRKSLAGNLSGGEQQMLELAMAMVHRPKMLLIDEPSIGLAPLAIGSVFNELQRLNEMGLTILLVEQNTRKAMEAASRAIVLRLGRIVWSGPTKSITHADLGDLFMTGKLAKAA